jgi:hypothetical protein
MICLLYRDFLLLASALRIDQIYTVKACIGLSELKIEDIDNGRGNEPTVPFQLDDPFTQSHTRRIVEHTVEWSVLTGP